MDYDFRKVSTSPKAAEAALIKAEEAYLSAMGWERHPTKPKLWTPKTKVGQYDHGDGLSRSSALQHTKEHSAFPDF